MESSRHLGIQQRSAILSIAFIVLLLGSLTILSHASNSTTQSELFTSNQVNGDSPTIVALPDTENASWTAQITPVYQYYNTSSSVAFDLIYNPALDILSGTNTANSSGNYATSTWLTAIRVRVFETGAVNVLYLPNSSVATGFITMYSGSTNVAGVGETTGVFQQDSILVTVSESDGAITPTGNGQLSVWVADASGNLLTQLFNTTVTGFAGVTHVAAFDPTGCTGKAASCTSNPVQTATAGYGQIVLENAVFSTSINLSSTFNMVYAIIPLVVTLAVVGMVLKYLKSMNVK